MKKERSSASLMFPALLIFAAFCATAFVRAVDLNGVPDLTKLVMQSYGVRRAWAEDARTIKIEIGASSTSARAQAESYRLVSRDDAAYAYEKFVRPVSANASPARTEFDYPKGHEAPNAAKLPLTNCEVTLTLPRPMQRGARYAVIAQGEGSMMVTAGRCAASFVYGGKKTDDPDTGFAAQMVGLRRVSSVGDGKILCEFGPGYSPPAGLALGNWTVEVNGTRTTVRAIGRRTRLECYYPVGWPFKGFIGHDVFLDLGRELESGDRIVVSCAPDLTAGARTAAFTFNQLKSITRSIKANQVGYLPNGPKIAYLGCWMGSMPEMNATKGADSCAADANVLPVDSFYSLRTTDDEAPDAAALAPYALAFRNPPRFLLVDEATGRKAFSGKAKLVHNGFKPDGKCNHSAENVYELDFSDFTAPGRYYISIAGVGRSLAFDISPVVYERALKAQAQGIYSQRCGCALDPKLSGGWERIPCHVADVTATTVQRSQSGEFGDFANNVETVPNPDFAKEKMRIKKVLDDPSHVSLSFTPEGRGRKAMYSIDHTKGATVAFRVRRDDSLAGGKWYGWVVRFGDEKYGIGIDVNWGCLSFHGNGKDRINDGKWRSCIVRIFPADASGQAEAEMFMDGKKWGGRRVVRDLNRVAPVLSLGLTTGDGAEGLTIQDEHLFGRCLNDGELAVLAAPLSKVIPRKLPIRGGHHDAGDYNPRSHIDVAQTLLNAYELRPKNFTDGQFNLPESERENGIPDIVDEALWALRLWEGLQDDDGGVRNGTESQGDPNFIQTVELDDRGDYAWAKDAKGSYLFAGAFAQASRVLATFKATRAVSARMLAKARKAYAWAVANPTRGNKNAAIAGEYNYSLRAYAASELFHTTGEVAYHEDFKAFTPWVKNPDAEMTVYGKYDLQPAVYSYMLIPRKTADPLLWDVVFAAIRREADMYLRGASEMAYKFIRHPFAPITWGTGAYENFAIAPAFVWALTGERTYYDWLVRTCDNTLGANPLGLSWITGLGERTIRCPLHNSRYRDTGFPADGLHAQGPSQRGEGYSWKECAYPAHNEGFAVMYAFSDVHFAIAMNEPVVRSMANTLFVFGLLAR